MSTRYIKKKVSQLLLFSIVIRYFTVVLSCSLLLVSGREKRLRLSPNDIPYQYSAYFFNFIHSSNRTYRTKNVQNIAQYIAKY